MGRLVKLVLFLVLLAFLGLVGFAYLGDLSPEKKQVTQPVTLDVD